jgi:hypothetical protein
MYLSNPSESFKRLDKAVLNTKTEQAAANEIMRSLAALGMARASIQSPEVFETRYDGSVLRIYVWRDTPYQDDVVLAAGPSFTSKVALGQSIPATNEVGLFIRGVLLDRKPRSLRSADKVLDREERRAAKAAAPRKPRTKKEAVAVVEETIAVAPVSAFTRPGGAGYRPGRFIGGEEGAALGRSVAAAVQAAKAATAAAVKASEDAEKAAKKAERAARTRKPKAEVKAAVQEADAAAAKAEAAVAKAEAAAEAVASVAPDDSAADAQLEKLASSLMKKLGL